MPEDIGNITNTTVATQKFYSVIIVHEYLNIGTHAVVRYCLFWVLNIGCMEEHQKRNIAVERSLKDTLLVEGCLTYGQYETLYALFLE